MATLIDRGKIEFPEVRYNALILRPHAILLVVPKPFFFSR